MAGCMTDEYNQCPAGGAFTLKRLAKRATCYKAISRFMLFNPAQESPAKVSLKVSGLEGEERRFCPKSRKLQNL